MPLAQTYIWRILKGGGVKKPPLTRLRRGLHVALAHVSATPPRSHLAGIYLWVYATIWYQPGKGSTGVLGINGWDACMLGYKWAKIAARESGKAAEIEKLVRIIRQVNGTNYHFRIARATI